MLIFPRNVKYNFCQVEISGDRCIIEIITDVSCRNNQLNTFRFHPKWRTKLGQFFWTSKVLDYDRLVLLMSLVTDVTDVILILIGFIWNEESKMCIK